MAAGLVIFMLAMAALSFWAAHVDKGKRSGYPSRRARMSGITFLMFAALFAILTSQRRAEDNRAVKTLEETMEIYPEADFEVRVNRTWIFETKDKPDAVAAFYERMGREKPGLVEKTDDFKFVAKTKAGGRARINISDNLKGSTISYILDDRK